jgi:beta-lactamase regulating signal transducer with metallopeptidase domain
MSCTHELIHVTQKTHFRHLIDRNLKVVFWFNPTLLLQKSHQLNHEFLADEKVVQAHNNVPFYQNLLINQGKREPNLLLGQ